MLNAHPELDWKSEVFHSFHESTESQPSGQDPFEILHRSIRDSESLHYGFETKFQHLDSNGLDIDFAGFLAKLQELGFQKYILLERKNYLRQAISVARGQLTKIWHVSQDQAEPLFSEFELDLESISLGGTNRKLEECFEFLDHTYQETTRVIEKSGVPLLHLTYENDLERDAEIGLGKTLSFLGLKKIKPNVSLRKLDSRPVSEMISNHDQLQDRLSKTRYRWMGETDSGG